MQRLVLWDVDGTLVRTGGAGAEVFATAMQAVLGVDAGAHGVRMSGKTDPQIAREILGAVEATAGLQGPELDEAVASVLAHIETGLATEIDRIRAQGHVLPGVPEVLTALHHDPGVLQSLLTGNIAPNAAVKVSAFGLEQFFDWEVGAFGSDHHDRLELVPLARAKAEATHGRRFAPQEVWVIGDTPRDLACARAAGASSLLVATGTYSLDELRAAVAAEPGPGRRGTVEEVRPDLSQVDDVLAILVG